MSVKAGNQEWKGSSIEIVGKFPTDQKGLCGKEDFLHIPEFTQRENRNGKSIMLHVQMNIEKDVLFCALKASCNYQSRKSCQTTACSLSLFFSSFVLKITENIVYNVGN